MKKHLFILSILSVLSQCGTIQRPTHEKATEELEGFVFIDISKIYHHHGVVTIINEGGDTLVHVKDKMIAIQGSDYETIEEEHLYKKNLNVESFHPEYGLFILRCYGSVGENYKVKINDVIGLINKDLSREFIEFKDLEKYVMETNPIPDQNNPVRIKPDENSEIVSDFEEWTFIPVEISGDWLKVRDNKDCYKGIAPSEKDIMVGLGGEKMGSLF
jgi:hypothetical protein